MKQKKSDRNSNWKSEKTPKMISIGLIIVTCYPRLILITFNVKALTQVNSQQLWMNFNTFSSSSRLNCAIRVNYNLDTVHKVRRIYQYNCAKNVKVSKLIQRKLIP